MRLFFAVLLDEVALARAGAAQAAMRAAAPGLSWAKPAQLHFTLAFLGEQPGPEAALAAGARVEQAAPPPFELAIQGAGAFPSTRRPRVVWLGAAQGAAGLGLLARALGAEEPYTPHLTVARVKTGQRGAERALQAAPAGEIARLRVGAFALMRSEHGLHSMVRSFALR